MHRLLPRLADDASEGTSSSVLVLAAILQAVLAMGGDPRRVLEALALDEASLGDPDGRIPFSLVTEAWERAAAETRDEAFGLHFAERVPVGAFALFDYVARSAPTLGEALGRQLRYQRLLHDSVVVDMVVTPETARLVLRVDGTSSDPPRHMSEATLAGYLVRGRRLSGVDLSPREVTLRHPAPRDLSEHERIFRCAVRFDSPENALVMDRASLDLPNAASDPGLLVVLDRQAEEILSGLPRVDSFLGRVRRCVTEMLRQGGPSLRATAQRLHMSPRTLQRRLRLEGTSFHAIADGLRREVALAHVADSSLSLGEVAFLVGFSGSSAFHRAFRKWTGRTPLQHRRSAVGPPLPAGARLG